MSSTARPSTIFEIGDLVRVPFPFVERKRVQARPALVIGRPTGGPVPLFWILMVTSARRGAWPGDVDVGPDHFSFGLPARCYIRTAKVATMSIDIVERRLGKLPVDVMEEVRERLRAALAWT